MILTSPSFENDAAIPRKFTCDGGGINPEFQIQNVPENAKSLALIVHDPDAPLEGGFFHWVVWNIGPRTTVIKEESAPPGAVEGSNDARNVGYTPPCPPPGHGTHHYHFKLYAVDAMFDLPTGTMATDLLATMKGHILTETELVGTYERK
jgi:Raf kinase inhibitor-like YbhB/YbcL family protein